MGVLSLAFQGSTTPDTGSRVGAAGSIPLQGTYAHEITFLVVQDAFATALSPNAK